MRAELRINFLFQLRFLIFVNFKYIVWWFQYSCEVIADKFNIVRIYTSEIYTQKYITELYNY